jgi:hypothetical protein
MERTPSRSPRRTTLVGVGLVLLLAVGAAVLLLRDDAPPRTSQPGDHETSQSGGDAASPATPSFRFTRASKEIVRTSSGRIGRRRRQASVRAARAAREILTDVYTEGFLDPANWKQGRYADAFRHFTRGAREHAEAHPALLTAGPRAGDRYERIEPRSGRMGTRILVDRGGVPTLLVSVVRFSAIASGEDSVTFRSRGQFFFERIDGSWRVVSFHVTRRDTLREAP